MLGEQEGNFARCLQLQLSELRWSESPEFVRRLVYRRMLSAAALRLFLGCAAHWKQPVRRVELQQGASVINTLASARGLGVLGSFTSRALFFDENLD